MLSATHTHSAPSLMRCLGTDADPNYPAFALPRIVEGLQRAVENLAPARVGWAVAPAPEHTHTRVWIRRPDKMLTDPFGELTVRANMHPGHQNPDAIGPSGPSDPALTLLAVQSPDGPAHRRAGELLDALLRRAGRLGGLLRVVRGEARAADRRGGREARLRRHHVAGHQRRSALDGLQPAEARRHAWTRYAGELAQIAADAYKTIAFHDWVPLAMREKTLRIATRQPDAKRLAWARDLVDEDERACAEVAAGGLRARAALAEGESRPQP